MSKTALITGASSGLGREFAFILAKKGYNLVLVARRKDVLDQMASKLKSKFKIAVITLKRDLTKSVNVVQLKEICRRKGIVPEVLINNAGFGDHGQFLYCDLKKQREMIDLNVKALVSLTGSFLPGMVKRGSGKILNVASLAAFAPGPLMSVYYASKSFVLSFTQALHRELRGTGVSATALCPGPTDTGFAKAAGFPENRKASAFSGSARKVAKEGIRAMEKGRAVVVPGKINKLSALGVSILPGALSREIIYWMQKG